MGAMARPLLNELKKKIVSFLTTTTATLMDGSKLYVKIGEMTLFVSADTVIWAGGSESGFTRDGVAVMPDDEKVQELSGSDMAHWLKLKPEEKKLNTKPQPQKWCTQAERQLAYDNYETTDDHGMQIYGIAKDQEGNEYYMVKNSWGTNSKYNGIWYASKAFVRYKTMNIVVHKDALPKAIKAKLGIK